jgi:predicted PurR-regulated permease PerM
MKNLAYTTIVFSGIVLVLVLGKSLLIPLVLAFFIWFIIHGIQTKINGISWVKRKVPSLIINLFTALLVLGTLAIFVNLLAVNLKSIMVNSSLYEHNVNVWKGMIPDSILAQIEEIQSTYVDNANLGGIVKSVASSISDFLGNSFLIILYLLFILLEQSVFKKKIEQIAALRSNPTGFLTTVQDLSSTIAEYINLKILVSLITGACSYFVFLIVGLDAPLFWAVIIFVLNFIPNIGSLVGTLFPSAFAMLQFGSYIEMLQILIPVGVIQLLVGNFVEPKIMGNSLNISGLVVLLSLSIWGLIWGITGMLLSVPLTVICTQIMAKFPTTKPIAILLGNGK